MNVTTMLMRRTLAVCFLLLLSLVVNSSHDGQRIIPSSVRRRCRRVQNVAPPQPTTHVITRACATIVGSCSDAIKVIFPRMVEYALASEGIALSSRLSGLTSAALLTLINIVVHCAWRRTIQKSSTDKDLKNFRWMTENFQMPQEKKELAKRPHTILLSAFSHSGLGHLAENLVELLLVGPSLERRLGNQQFSRFYMASIYISEVINQFVLRPLRPEFKDFLRIPSSSWWKQLCKHVFKLIFRLYPSSMGASGAICALDMYFCLEFPPFPFCRKTQNNRLHHHGIEEGEDESAKETGTKNGHASRRKDTYVGPVSIQRWFIFIGVFEDFFYFDHHDPRNQMVGRCSHLGGYASGLFFYCWRRWHQSPA